MAAATAMLNILYVVCVCVSDSSISCIFFFFLVTSSRAPKPQSTKDLMKIKTSNFTVN